MVGALLDSIRVRKGASGKLLGAIGERTAWRHLRRQRYRLLMRNATTPIGEADLVCLAPDKKTLVVVEVKCRRAPCKRRPEDNITRAKRAKLCAVTRDLVRRNGWGDRPLRIDVVAVVWPEDGPPTVRHHTDAVRPGR